MTLPISRLVQVSVNLAQAGAQGRNFNNPLMLGDSDVIDVEAPGPIRNRVGPVAYPDDHLLDGGHIYAGGAEIAQWDVPLGPLRRRHNRWIGMGLNTETSAAVLEGDV